MSDDNIKSIALARVMKSQDNRKWTPVECLLDAAEDIRSGAVACDKLLVLRINTTDEKFNVGYNAANIKASEILAALECAKAQILQEMGYSE